MNSNATKDFDEDLMEVDPPANLCTHDFVGMHIHVVQTANMQDSREFEYITIGIIGTVIVFFGVIANILSILVWNRKSMRSTTGTHLIALSSAGLAHLLFFFLAEGVQILSPDILESYQYGVFYSYVGFPFYMMFLTCNIWITVGLTADRCIKVCWSQKAQTLCSQRRALISIVLIVISCSLINIPHFLVYEPLEQDNRTNHAAFNLTEFGVSDSLHQYEFWLQCMFLVIVPVVSIFTCNMLIICKVRTINRLIGSKKGTAGKEKSLQSESQLTRLLLTVTFTFLILNSLECIVSCFVMLKAGNSTIVSYASKLSKLAEVINSSISFLLYCVSGRRFRKELVKVLCCQCREAQNNKTGYTTTTASTSATAILSVTPKLKTKLDIH